MDYPVEPLTAAERARLAPHVTNLDRPVFALVNLPETVKGALFARYSRYQGTPRRRGGRARFPPAPRAPRPRSAVSSGGVAPPRARGWARRGTRARASARP